MGKLRPWKRHDLFIRVTDVFIATTDWHFPRAWHELPYTARLAQGILTSFPFTVGNVKIWSSEPIA